MNQLKIAIIVNPLIPVPPEKYGGIERIVYMLIQELVSFGHKVTLYAHPASKPNCNLRPYQGKEHFNLKDLVNINLLTSKIAFEHFDVVHTFGRMSNITLLMLSKIPKIVSYQLPPTLSQIDKAIKISRKNSIHFTGCSNFISNQIRTITETTTIYNGVNTDDYAFSKSVAADAPLVFLGRIQSEKGTHIAIEIAKRTNKKLIIAGNIPKEKIHQDYFEEFIQPLIDNEQIKYIGPVNDLEKSALLGKALAFLMPVTWDEPFGIVMAEALACGTPIIGFRKGAIPEIVAEGINGFICDSLEEMVKAVNNASLINRENCRAKACEKFSSTIIAKAYENLYFEVIKQTN